MGEREVHVDVAEALAAGVRRAARRRSRARSAAEHRVGRELAASRAPPRRSPPSSSSRARRRSGSARLNSGAVSSLLSCLKVVRVLDRVRVVAGDRRHHLDRARSTARSRPPSRRRRSSPGSRRSRSAALRRDPLGAGVERQGDVGALRGWSCELVDDRRELVLLAGQQRRSRTARSRSARRRRSCSRPGCRTATPAGSGARRPDGRRRPRASTRRSARRRRW